jgi:RimJ/RimL family protein N-acetyltransferase
MTPSPSLTTERLTLTPPTMADFEDSAALWADPDVVRYISGTPSTRSEAWARFQRMVGGWTLLGYGAWVVRATASGRFVGEVGFGDFKREITPSFEGAPEAGWVLAPWSHGQGFATEAVAAAHVWGDARFEGPRTVCIIDPDNTASLRVAAKAGYRIYGRSTYRDSEVLLHERPSPGRQAGGAPA